MWTDFVHEAKDALDCGIDSIVESRAKRLADGIVLARLELIAALEKYRPEL